MKKLLGLAFIVVFGMALIGCGSSSPSGVSDEVFDLASQGLEVVDDYLDDDLDRTTAVVQLDELLDDLERVIDNLVDYDDLEEYDEDIEWALIRVTDAVDDGFSYSDESEMQIRRDELAELLDN